MGLVRLKRFLSVRGGWNWKQMFFLLLLGFEGEILDLGLQFSHAL